MPNDDREVLVIRGRLDRAGRFTPRRCRSTMNVRAWPVVESSDVVIESLDRGEQVLHREKAAVRLDIGCGPGDLQYYRILAYIQLRPDAVAVRLRRDDVMIWRSEIPPPAELGVDLLKRRPSRSEPLVLRLRYSEPGDGAHVCMVYRWGPRQFRVVYVGPPAKDLEVDLSSLPGGEECLVAVTYSNGMRSAHAATKAFSVPRHGPSVSVVRPDPGAEIVARTPVILEGILLDAERPGGSRPYEDLVWLVDGVEVGRGLITSVDGLLEGAHTIAAVYRSEPEAVASIEVRVRESQIPPASDWPDWDPLSGDLTR